MTIASRIFERATAGARGVHCVHAFGVLWEAWPQLAAGAITLDSALAVFVVAETAGKTIGWVRRRLQPTKSTTPVGPAAAIAEGGAGETIPAAEGEPERT